MDIGAVERETGISKDTLRVWERRYGFPKPLRSTSGERRYPAQQLARLHKVRRLIDRGMRPGAILRLSDQELTARLSEQPVAGANTPPASPVGELTALLEHHRAATLQARLSTLLLRQGLQRFVAETAAPLTVEIGELWAAGRISIAQEHRYTEMLQQFIRGAMRNDPAAARRPRVLLTTLPGEPHALGMLMAQAWLAAEDIECISLGTQTPASEVVAAARDIKADVVGLSFSRIQSTHRARAALASLRTLLDRPIVVWAGGSIWRQARKKIAGVEYIVDFADLSRALARWA
jgi:MerR family transcriptional regulator, light-induced transcriptional regulator